MAPGKWEKLYARGGKKRKKKRRKGELKRKKRRRRKGELKRKRKEEGKRFGQAVALVAAVTLAVAVFLNPVLAQKL